MFAQCENKGCIKVFLMEILFFMLKLLNYNAKDFEISWQAGMNYI